MLISIMSEFHMSLNSSLDSHPGCFFILGLKHPKVIENIIYHSEKDYFMLEGFIKIFKETQRGNPAEYDVEKIKTHLLQDIVKARTHLGYLRDNVDELDFVDYMFEKMNKIGVNFDKLEEKLRKL